MQNKPSHRQAREGAAAYLWHMLLQRHFKVWETACRGPAPDRTRAERV